MSLMLCVLSSAANLLRSELAVVVADESQSEIVSDICRALSLWLALSQFPEDIISSERKSEGRRKAYYKHFQPLLRRGLESSLGMLKMALSSECTEFLLAIDIWHSLCTKLTRILTPVPDAHNLQKISRVPEVIDIVKAAIDFVPAETCNELCSVLSQGAAEALAVEKAHRNEVEDKSDSEINRRRTKYREDALLVFKTCYAGMCKRKPDDPALLSITDKAFADALATVNESDDVEVKSNVSVDTFLMVCKAFEENPGMEALIISSFPLLCKLAQTQHEAVRNAAAGALGSADLRQVLTDARLRYEDAEQRATAAEKQVAELNKAVLELQKKNEVLQQQVELSPLHLT